MKPKSHIFTALRVLFAVLALAVASFLGAAPALAAGIGVAVGFVNPFAIFAVGVAPYPGIGAQGVSDLNTLSADAQQVLYEMELVASAQQVSPFGDNMTGGMGSRKPFINVDDTKKLAGQEIAIQTDEALGGPGAYGAENPAGLEEQEQTGGFRLKIGHWTTSPVAITNEALSLTIPGVKWTPRTREKLRDRLSKKQSDDQIMVLLSSANSFNTVYPTGKTLDTLDSADIATTDLIIATNGRLKDIGAMTINANRTGVTRDGIKLPPIPRYLWFTTDSLARPIKSTSAYSDGTINAGVRGDENRFFTGEYSDIDGNIIYSWGNVIHGGLGSIGSPLQPEALLGTAIVAKGTSPNLAGGVLTSTAGGLDGGGTNAAAAALPYRDYFENFSLFLWKYINGKTSTLGSGTRYFAIKNKSDGKISLFSYTTNTRAVGITSKNQLSGLKRLGSTVTGDYVQTIGDVTWSTSATPGAQGYTTLADGNGFMGLSEGVIEVGSRIYETNSKFQPIGRGLHLGAMAGVSGYGKVADLEKGTFHTAALLVDNVAPYGTARGQALKVCYGTAAFQRSDDNTPNYVRFDLARSEPGFPVIG